MLRTALFFLCLSAAAHADDKDVFLGTAVDGIQVTVTQNGELSMSIAKEIRFDTGKVAVIDGKRWKVEEQPDTTPVSLQPVDFVLYGEKYLGRAVQLSNMKVFAADIDNGLLEAPGGAIAVLFSGADRATLRPLLLNCSGLMVASSACIVDVVGTASLLTNGKIGLIDPKISPAKPVPGQR